MIRPCPDCDNGVQYIDAASRFDHEHETREVECEGCGGAGTIDVDDDEMEASE